MKAASATKVELDLLDEMVQLEDLEEERAIYEESLIEFTRAAWPEIGESGEFIVNWHHEQIAADLEALAAGQVRDEIFNVPPRTSKALDCDTPVLTTWGWKRHGDLVPGDFVFGPDGAPKRVLAITPQTVKPVFEVQFDDQSVIVAAGDHLWSVERDHPYGGFGSTRCRKTEIVTTEEMRSA